MRYLIILFLATCLFGCANSELKALQNDLDTDEAKGFSYKVGGFETFHCEPRLGQEILRTWSKSLKEAPIASWPDPDNYLILSFKNGHRYWLKTYIGDAQLQYSVLYANGVYTGESLIIDSVCPGLKAHGKSLKVPPGASTPLAH